MHKEKSSSNLKERYVKNSLALSAKEVKLLHGKKVCVIGCGGLGGYVVEMLARVGVGYITVVDNDVFEASNLNRQLFSTEQVIGVPKVEVAKRRVKEVNSQVKLNGLHIRFDESNGKEIVRNHDIVIDALDSVKTRLLLEKVCANLALPLVHGSIGGWYGQVTSILPGDDTIHKIYQNVKEEKGAERILGNLPFSAALVASMQCAECIKILTGKGNLIRKEILQVDLLEGEFYKIEL